ncbi:MAG: efflux transporter periplasmic adaptor subunit [Xanthobacteraceae bacterium]|jgi:multidrug efflux system membrane fusion protein|nr:efflux transporter periplasmic adaptor subunit [Xanthobacteraceae bacterium]
MNATDETPIRKRKRGSVPLVLLAIAALAGGVYVWRENAAVAAPPPAAAARPAVPVNVASVERRDVAVTLAGLGTVQASQTVNIHTRVDGTLQAVTFTEGQNVRAGDVLARLDPRLAQAALEQAEAAKAKDEAQLRSAQADLVRFTQLAQKDFASKQQLDQQQATVDQLKASIASDVAAIASAQTDLEYMTITAPVDGRMGIRQLDAGNVIHASDTTPIAVLATLKPISVLFTLPEKNLDAVQKAMAAGPVTVVATRADGTELGTGTLSVVDNQIDSTTGTIRLKGVFPNEDERLWPGAFVHASVNIATLKDALTVPTAAVQRGPDGLYAWVVDADGAAVMRPIETGEVSDGVMVVKKGLAAGDQVVTNGQYRLRPKTLVAIIAKTANENVAQDDVAHDVTKPGL